MSVLNNARPLKVGEIGHFQIDLGKLSAEAQSEIIRLLWEEFGFQYRLRLHSQVEFSGTRLEDAEQLPPGPLRIELPSAA